MLLITGRLHEHKDEDVGDEDPQASRGGGVCKAQELFYEAMKNSLDGSGGQTLLTF